MHTQAKLDSHSLTPIWLVRGKMAPERVQKDYKLREFPNFTQLSGSVLIKDYKPFSAHCAVCNAALNWQVLFNTVFYLTAILIVCAYTN